MVKNVLIICMGNVGRSPLVAAALEEELRTSGINVMSRGLREPSTIKKIKTANPELLKLLEALAARKEKVAGKSPEALLAALNKHSPKVASAAEVEKADLIIVMSPSLLSELKEKFGAKVQNLGAKSFTAREYISKNVYSRNPRFLKGKRGRVVDQVYYDREQKKWRPKPGVIVSKKVGLVIPHPVLKKHLSEGIRIGRAIGGHLKRQIRK